LNKIDFVWFQIEVGGNAEQIGLLAGDVVVQVTLLILPLSRKPYSIDLRR
jgi:hypothetical protein